MHVVRLTGLSHDHLSAELVIVMREAAHAELRSAKQWFDELISGQALEFIFSTEDQARAFGADASARGAVVEHAVSGHDGWRSLHDATLEQVVLDWASGETTVRVSKSLQPSEMLIRVKATTLLRCPREYPWGRSKSINCVRSQVLQKGTVQLHIEMQSGDTIEIEGDALELV